VEYHEPGGNQIVVFAIEVIALAGETKGAAIMCSPNMYWLKIPQDETRKFNDSNVQIKIRNN
jgi:hypothetical protein